MLQQREQEEEAESMHAEALLLCGEGSTAHPAGTLGTRPTGRCWTLLTTWGSA